ncbi:MAG: hypothetical protein ACT6TH_10690 [Brevundimonas sp.]|uniref:hypothetical protein n=1 Tax=Brevundimonas sp. TaxID=1871086 RepID=UPI0040337783
MSRPEDSHTPNDWTDLTEVWTRPAAGAEPDLTARFVRRRAWLSRLNFLGEAGGALIAGGVGLWAALRHDAVFVGLAALAFAVFGLAATLWARRGAAPGDLATPRAAVEAAVRQANSGLRWARAGQAVSVAALGFLGVMAWQDEGPVSAPLYGGALLFLAAAVIFYERHARKARARIRTHAKALSDLDRE